MLSLSYRNWGLVPDNTLTLEPGVHLLKGGSGIGKTSTLQALNFALYGTNHLEHIGQPVVELEYLGLRIRRQKKPERLQVWFENDRGESEHGEDETGQAMIDRIIATEEQYILGMHIEQRQWNKFFQVPAGERLSLLEGIIGKPAPVEAWLTYLAKERNTYQGQLMAQEATLKQIVVPSEVSGEYMRNEKQIQSLKSALETLDQEIEKTKATLTVARERKRQQTDLNHQLNALPEAEDVNDGDLKSLFSRRGDLNDELTKARSVFKIIAKRDDLLAQLNKLGFTLEKPPLTTSEVSKISQQRKIKDLIQKVNTLLHIEFTGQDIASAHPEWKEYLTHQLAYSKWLEQVTEITKKINQIPEIDMEALIATHTKALVADFNQPCPACGVNLALSGGKLIHATGSVMTKAQADQREREYQNKLSKAKSRQQLVTQLAQLETNKIEPPEELSIDIGVLKQVVDMTTPFLIQLAAFNHFEDIDVTKHTTGNQILKEYQTLPEINTIPRSVKTISEELADVESQIQRLQEQQQISYKRKLIQDQLQTLVVDNIDMLTKTVNKLNKEYNIIVEEINNANAYTQYQQWAEYYTSVKDSCDEYSKHIEAIGILEKELVLSQHLYVQQLLDNLNSLFQEITQALFEEPIIVRLESFKQLKNGKNKPGLNVSITINGITRDALKKVSQGQADRISLAFTLAVAKLMGGKFLLLDEVGSSFNGLREMMFETIREYGPPLVILTEHGIESNEYDSVLQLNSRPRV